MPAIRSGDRQSLGLDPGKVLTVTADSISSAIVRTFASNTQGIQSNGQVAVSAGGAQSFGPYLVGQRFVVEGVTGSVNYSLDDARPNSSGDKPVSASSDGGLNLNSNKFSVRDKQISFAVAGQCNLAVFGQLSNGQYVCTDQSVGLFARQLFLLTGDPLVPGYTTQALTGTDMGATNALKNTLGAVVGGNTNGGIFNAWPTSNGDIYFVARGDADTRNYLFRAKAGTYTVGSDAGYSNKQACIDIGRYGGSHTDGIRHLSNRSFLEAKVGSATHLFFCEYNVASGRTSGGANDQAIVWRSTDGGTTWAIFLEFNTGGSHVIDHFHGAVQDPYSKWIYFMTGDTGTQCNVIAYNGTAAAPAANTTLATLAATAGYKVLSGNELARYCDLCFSKDGIYSLPDTDSESADTSTIGFVSTFMPKMLDYVSSIGPTTRQTNLPPLLALQQPGWAAMISFRTHVDAVTPEPYLQIWATDYEAGTWTLVAKLRNYRLATGIPKGWFMDQAGRVWVSGTYGGGIQFSQAVNTGTSIALTPQARPSSGLPLVYDGA